MINEGKNKIQHLRQFRNMSDEVLKQMNEIMKPIDEKKEFLKYWEKK